MAQLKRSWQYWHYYRPRSKASEGYVFTGICLSNLGGGGGGVRWATRDQVTTPPSPPRTRSQHLPPSLPTQDQVTTTPPPIPRDYAQAGGTPPTGMHSLLWRILFTALINFYLVGRTNRTYHRPFLDQTGKLQSLSLQWSAWSQVCEEIGRQEVGRYSTRGFSQGKCNKYIYASAKYE